ncbi:MAG: competence protein ComK [Erysipelotrichaceae bacterium]|nr:competence protein ComK [Erysipelotrichaceae bacterium]MDP3304482.1 competence protein ComK [Erysipelotrichaceae bacterium]
MRLFDNMVVFYKSGADQTTVIDIYGDRTDVEVSINALLESLCAANGLSLDAALMNSKKIMKAKKYPPINLCYRSKISYFRVASVNKDEQIWIKFSPHLKFKVDKNGQKTLVYQERFLMNVDFDQRRFKYQFRRIKKYYHNDKKCPIQEILLKALKIK